MKFKVQKDSLQGYALSNPSQLDNTASKCWFSIWGSHLYYLDFYWQAAVSLKICLNRCSVGSKLRIALAMQVAKKAKTAHALASLLLLFDDNHIWLFFQLQRTSYGGRIAILTLGATLYHFRKVVS